MAIVYIGLGSNLDNPKQQLINARVVLEKMQQTQLIMDSGLFQSKAMTMANDDQPQADYINAVIKLQTSLAPHVLLDKLQAIETEQGRTRTKRWGARTLDLDILMYDDLQIDDERLTLPHPGISERDFVLHPLSRIESHLNIPGQGKLNILLEKLSDKNIKYLGAFCD
jgi:2-amino-4-hydroxy-6-hydroxymethyldihydropteridine diphosphokinase